MISATWPQAARNVPMDLLLHLTKHRAQANKIASHVLKVAIMQLSFYKIFLPHFITSEPIHTCGTRLTFDTLEKFFSQS